MITMTDNNSVEMDKACREIADHYGKIQATKAMEELAELQRTIAKLYIADKMNAESTETDLLRENVAEEMADVIIMLNQICHLYDMSFSDINNWIGAKLERQLNRINDNEGVK